MACFKGFLQALPVELDEQEPVLEEREREPLVRASYLLAQLPTALPSEAELAPLLDAFHSEAHTASYEVVEDKLRSLGLPFTDRALRRCHAEWARLVAEALDVMCAQGIVVQEESDYPQERDCGCWVTGVGVVAPGCFFRHVRARSEVEAFAFVDGMGFEAVWMGWLRKELVGWAQLAALWYLLDGILAWHAADKFGGTTHAHKERGFSGLSFGAEESISAMFTAKPGERWSDQSRVGFQYLDIDDPDRKCRGQIPSLVLWLAGRNSAEKLNPRGGVHGVHREGERYAVVIEVTRGDAWGAAEDSYRSACKQGLFMMVPGVRGRDIALTTSDPELLARQNPDVIGEVFCELLIVEKQDEDVHALDPVDGTVNAHVVASMETAASVETLRAVAAACGLTDRSSWKPNSLFARWLGGNTTNADLPYPCGDKARVQKCFQQYSDVYRSCQAATPRRADRAELDPADVRPLGLAAVRIANLHMLHEREDLGADARRRPRAA